MQAHEVFTLRDLSKALRLSPRAALDRVKYHRHLGRLKTVTKGVYAAVPTGHDVRNFHPDRFLVAATIRPDAIFSHHAALELLGAAHSDWNVCTVFTTSLRPPVSVGSVEIRFLNHPPALVRKGLERLGTREEPRLRVTLRITGPERTLLDGFRQPRWAGGPEELVESATGLGTLDLKLLLRLLEAYDEKLLWGATGWFLERYQRQFFVPLGYLTTLEKRRPKSPHYLLRSQRGGVMASRWNVILPESVMREKGSGEV